MKNLKDKIQTFTLGLTFGLLIGCGFFIFKLDDYFKELSFYKDLTQKMNTQAMDQQQAVEEKAKAAKVPFLLSRKVQQKNSIPLKTPVDSMSASEKMSVPVSDSSRKDSLLVGSQIRNSEDDVVVRKDELIFVKDIEVVSLNHEADHVRSAKDSALKQISGVREDAPAMSCKIEFWKSPLNYKGYKMAKNKIVLYGIDLSDGLKLFRLDNAIYLRHLSVLYKLEFSGDFRQMEKISDEALLAKLK